MITLFYFYLCFFIRKEQVKAIIYPTLHIVVFATINDI